MDELFYLKFINYIKVVDEVGGITYCYDQAFTTTQALILNDYNDYGKKKLYVKKDVKN